MLTGVDILLTYQCTSECDHCFLHCSPRREATFTIGQLRELLREIRRIKTVDTVYFEGGETFLFYAVLLAGLRMVYDAGCNPASSPMDTGPRLRKMRSNGCVPCST